MRKLLPAALLLTNVGYAQTTTPGETNMETTAATGVVTSKPESIVNDVFVGSSFFQGTFSGRTNYNLISAESEAKQGNSEGEAEAAELELSATGKVWANENVAVMAGVDYSNQSFVPEGQAAILTNNFTPRVNALFNLGGLELNTFVSSTFTTVGGTDEEKETGIVEGSYNNQTLGASVLANRLTAGLTYKTQIAETLESDVAGTFDKTVVEPSVVTVYGKYEVIPGWTAGLALAQNSFDVEDSVSTEDFENFVSTAVSSELAINQVRSEVIIGTYNGYYKGSEDTEVLEVKTYTGYSINSDVEVGLNVNVNAIDNEFIEGTEVAYGLSGSVTL